MILKHARKSNVMRLAESTLKTKTNDREFALPDSNGRSSTTVGAVSEETSNQWHVIEGNGPKHLDGISISRGGYFDAAGKGRAVQEVLLVQLPQRLDENKYPPKHTDANFQTAQSLNVTNIIRKLQVDI